jgi:hypothetical protein
MRWRAVVLGIVMIAAPGLPAAMLLEAPAPVPKAWPSSPEDKPAAPPPRWDAPAIAALEMLRRVSANESRRSDTALAACEVSAGRATGTRRNARFRACATAPLARTDSFAGANSRMLSVLAGNSGPTETCLARVMALSGTAGSLSMSARMTLRGGLDLPWDELVEMSRGIRALAGEVRRLARAPHWRVSCRVRPPAAVPKETA